MRHDQHLARLIQSAQRVFDLGRAQVASIKTGERRFLELLRRYGKDAVVDSIQRIYEQSERLARASVSTIPDGVYEAESFMDDDGITRGATSQSRPLGATTAWSSKMIYASTPRRAKSRDNSSAVSVPGWTPLSEVSPRPL